MKKTKKVLLTALSYVLVVALAIWGTIAYLMSSDSDVNVMTMGNVKIEQLEYERVVDENGDPVKGVEGTDFTADYDITESYKLQPFTQAKPAMPAVYTEGKSKWGEFQQLWNQVGAPGSNDLFDDSMKNVIDKFVFVENTGKSDAYYRSIVAIEVPEEITEETIHSSFNGNSRFDYNSDIEGSQNAENSNKFYTTIDGVRYRVYVATYTEKLEPGDVSRPSLLQLYLDPKTTNEDVEKFGDTWDVLVLSQAVQADGFDDAQTALNTSFGEVNEENANKWFSGTTVPATVKTLDELKKAVTDGGKIILSDDIEVTEMVEIPENGNVTIDGQGYTLTRADSYTGTILSLGEYAELALSNITLDGENTESTGNLVYIDSFGKLILNDGAVLENHVGGTTYENDPYRGPENSVIHCDGETTIVMNEGSLIQNNIAKGNFATVIMSSYGVTCELNGGKIINNTSEKNNYTVWFGNYANVTVSDGFEAYGNTDGGLMRVNQQTTFTMNGGKLDGNGKSAIYTWSAKYVTLNGGEIVGNVNLNYVPATVGGTDVNGVIYKDNEVTKWAMNLTPDFGTVRYSIAGNITQLNIVPAEGYTYATGDENKLVCENAGYKTYWDAENGCFKVTGSN